MPEPTSSGPVIRRRHPWPLAALLFIALVAGAADAQDNPVYVNDSPAALAQLRQAEDQVADNPGEAVRLFQELLDTFPMKVVPVTPGASDHFVSVRRRVLRELRADQDLLDRYRLVATPQGRRMLEAGQWRRLAVTRPLTEPGLHAMLALAQQQLESAAFDPALNWLGEARQHPDCTGRLAAHAWHMTALAQHFTGSEAAFQRSRKALLELGEPGQKLVKQLDAMVGADNRPRDHRGQNLLDQTNVSDISELIAQPIWSHQLDETLLRRRLVDPSVPESQRQSALEPHRRNADLMTPAATVCGDFVYVNEGFRVTAFDRFMGNVRWSYLDSPSLAMLDRDSDPPLDLSIVEVFGDALVTFTGHAHATHRSGTGGIICLDRFTGELRWETSLENILAEEDPDDLYPHGAPIIASGAVYTLARKVSRQRLTSTYAVALDLHDGSVLWSRYLTSSGGLHRSGRPVSAPSWHDGWLYVATPIGAMARLNPNTGEIDWMRRFSVPMNVPFQDQTRRPWEFTRPVVTPAGMFALQPDNRRVVLLNAHSGDTIASYPATSGDAWGEVRYLLANDTHVFAIGREIRAFSVDGLDRAQWTLPPPRTSRYAEDQSFVASNELTALDVRGRVQLVEGMLVVPALQGVLFVDGETGSVDHRLMVEPGNPLAADAQLFHVGSDRINAYMSFDRAQEMLRQRIEAEPSDPAPALSLLRLGIRVDDLELALSAADLAQHAIQLTSEAAQSRATQQQRLFELLLTIDERGLADTPERAEALYATLASVAVGPKQRVEYLLAYGDWLADHDIGQAVETYQRLLSDAQLASVTLEQHGVRRAASHRAAQRLRELMRDRGAQVYAAQADFAQRRLDELAAQTPLDVDGLLELAREYPFAPAAVAAAERAVDRMQDQGRARDALAALLAQQRLSQSQSTARRLLGRALRLCVDNDWQHDGRSIITYVQARYGSMELHHFPQGRDGPVSLAQWRSRLDVSGAAEAKGQPGAEARPGAGLAVIGRPGERVRQLLGTVVPMHRLSEVRRDPRSVLAADGSVLTLYDAQTLTARWSLDLSQRVTAALQQCDERIVLWQTADDTDQRLSVIDPDDGSVRWVSSSLFELFGRPDAQRVASRRLNEQLPDGTAFDPAESLPLVTTSAASVVIVRRIGGAVAFNVAGEQSQLRWQVEDTLDQVHYAALSDTSLVLAGLDRATTGGPEGAPGSSGSGAVVSRIMVLDPVTGETVGRFEPLEDEPVRWMQLGPLGRLVYGNAAGIEAIDVRTGERVWMNTSYEARESAAGWVVGTDVVYQQRTRLLCSLDLDSGVIGEEFSEPAREQQWDPYDSRQVQVHRGRVYVLYPQRVVCYASDGRRLGQDVVVEERDYRWLLPAEDRLVVISASSRQVNTEEPGGRQTQYTYRLYSMSPNCRLLGRPADVPGQRARVEHADLADGWVLLSTTAETTLAVPMPSERAMNDGATDEDDAAREVQSSPSP